MDESDVQELGTLRARAYGRAADIDEAGRERLRELEARARGEQSAPPVPPTAPVASRGAPAAVAQAAPGAPPRPPVPPAPASAPGTASAAAPGPAPGPRRTVRRPLVLIGAGLVVIALVAGAVTLANALSRPGQVAALAATPDVAWPPQFGDPPEGSALFEPFHGLSVVMITRAWATSVDLPCLFISQPVPSGAILTVGCGQSEFPPTAGLRVTEALPPELRERHPVGTELQFVLEGGTVHVYASDG